MSSLSQFSIGPHSLQVRQQGAGTPVLFVHGFPLDHQMWNEQFSVLGRSFRLIAPDLRGFGGSSIASGTVRMEDYADDLANLLDAMAIREPIVICALSMGGYIAFQFALKYRAKLRGLVLCDTRSAADKPEAAAGRLKTADQVLAEGPTALADGMIPKLFGPAALKDQPEIVAQTRQIILKTSREGIAAALRGMAERPDVTSALPNLDVPALLICGSEDVITPAKEMATVAAALPNARFVEIQGAGHMSPLEAPAEVNLALTEFLATI